MPAPRAPLGKISGNRPKIIELTPVQCSFIEDTIQFDTSFLKVAESLNCSKGIISNTLRLASEQYNGESKLYFGRPQK